MDRILGQSRAVNTLQMSLDGGRVHHAWMFHGPVGVGKHATAIEFARILLDPDATRDLAGHLRADPGSRTSKLIDHDNHPDLHIIRKELALFSEDKGLRNRKLTNIPIDVLRQFMIGGRTADGRMHEAPAYLTANMHHGKVFIIEEAELLDDIGQNAILKTLEEPPPRTYFILLTTQESDLLPTIRSRCQRVAFTPLDPSSMKTWLDRATLDVKPEERAWIERFAEGSPGMAMLAAKDRLFEWHIALRPIVQSLDQGRYDPAAGEAFTGLVDQYATAWVSQRENASKDAANKDGAARVFMLLASHARQCMRERIERDGDPGPWPDLIETINDAERVIDSSVNLKHALENLAVQWADIAGGGMRV